jgi:hypothetical protein
VFFEIFIVADLSEGMIPPELRIAATADQFLQYFFLCLGGVACPLPLLARYISGQRFTQYGSDAHADQLRLKNSGLVLSTPSVIAAKVTFLGRYLHLCLPPAKTGGSLRTSLFAVDWLFLGSSATKRP